MTNQIYTRNRFTVPENGVFETVLAEMRTKFEAAKTLLDAELDKHEQYDFDARGFKILTKDSKPIRKLECVHLIIKSNIVVGACIMRATNHQPTHGVNALADMLTREYELRFKTFAGADFTVESAGIAFCQRGNGPMYYNTGNVAGFNTQILKRHWDEFKTNVDFTQADIDAPTKLSFYSERFDTFARSV